MFNLTFLGTAASMPSSERGLPALLIGAGSARFLIDCGEGTTRQMLRAGTGFRRLGHILLTHADLDHVLGLGGLVATLGLIGRRSELAIFGSGETLGLVERYLAGLWPQRRAPVPLRLVELAPGQEIDPPATAANGYRISCFPVRHRRTASLGYRFERIARPHLRADRLAAFGVPEEPLRARLAGGEEAVLEDGRRIAPQTVQGPPAAGASLAVVGDAEEVESLIAPVRGADALVIEATFLEADAALAAARGHLTAAQAGRLAAEAEIGTLYLTHISGRYDPAAIAAEAGRFFSKIVVAKDFDRVSVTAAPRAGSRLPSL